METTSPLAQAICEGRERLLESWRGRVQGAVDPSSTPLSEIIDTLPALLDEVVAALRAGAGNDQGRAGEIGGVHGTQRFRSGFSLGSVIREYGILRDCFFELAAERGLTGSLGELHMVMRMIDAAMASGAEQYAWERDQLIETQSQEYFGFVAHELRNPLNSAFLAAQALQARPGAEHDGTIDVLLRNLGRLRHLVDNSLVSVRIRQLGRARGLALADVSLRALVNAAIRDLASDAQARNVVIHVEGEAVARADPRLLQSAVTNLLGNAVKYSKAGGRIEARIRSTDELAALEIEDECGGLPEGKAEELFTPFVQRGADRSGFGLGLAIAKDAVEAHQGSVQVTNLPGQGCVFMITLPARGQ